MSSPQQPAPDAAQHQAAQGGLAVVLGASLAALWASLDVTRLATALPAFKAGVAAVVIRHAQASATLAAQQYRQQRVAAGVSGGFRPSPAPPPPVQQIAQAVDWAVQPLWNANVLAAATGQPEAPPTEALPSAGSAIADAKARLAASSERLVTDTGARTITDNAEADPKARGYARIPEPGACSFCLMLAARGAVFKTDRAGRATGDSFAASNAKFKDGKVPSTIKVHDHCQCHAEPVFGVYEPPARVREAEALWISSTRGKSGNAARIAFRQAVEGRTAPTK